jgi:AAA ATPase domain
LVLHGLRGVGKTVLLNRMAQDAEQRGIACVRIESPEVRSLPAALIPALRSMLIRLDRIERLRDGARRAMAVLASFTASMKLRYADIEVSIDVKPETGNADSGDLEVDLSDLFTSLGSIAREGETAVALFIDELQYTAEPELGALIAAFHHAAQRQLPIAMIAAGLPQILGQAGRAKSYVERLFEFALIDRLTDEAATQALCEPALRARVAFEADAVGEVLRQTKGYPYFLQEWGKHAWNLAVMSPIRRADAVAATSAALSELDGGFFRVRLDRVTPKEKGYLRAMAELGVGPHRSGDIASCLGRAVEAVAPIRSALIAKGMIYGPAHGDTAFTVPLFDGFMKRIMPEFQRGG